MGCEMQRVKVKKKSSANGTTFKKGHEKVGGAKKGVSYKHLMTRKIAEALVSAAVIVGDNEGEGGMVGYFVRLATDDYDNFVSLLRAIIPKEGSVKVSHEMGDGSGTYETREQILKAFEVRGLPIPPRLIDITPSKVERK